MSKNDTIESEGKVLSEGTTVVELWLRKIAAAREEEKEWRQEAEKAVGIYEADDDEHVSDFNLFHSNVQTMLPALYNSTPVPDVRRRHGDADPVAKLTVDMNERALSYTLDQYDFDGAMECTILDALVTGRGVIRVRYEPQMVSVPDPMTGEPIEQKGAEETTSEVVAWDRFVRGPGRRWEDLPWVAFKHELTREELAQLNPELAERIEFPADDRKGESKSDIDEKGILSTTCVYEIWDRRAKEVLFVAEKHHDEPLLVQPDPLGLKNFFPLPRPIYAIRRVSGMTPVCPYSVHERLYDEMDTITKRIRKLTGQLRVRGLVASNIAKDMEFLRAADDGQYAEATDGAAFLTGGGKLENAIAHWPLGEIVGALAELYKNREETKQKLYEATGIADIMRGATNANETLGAQQLKAQWGSLRIQRMQKEVQRLARDLFRLKSEIMAKHFEPQNMIAMANFTELAPDQMQAMPQAIELFKSDQSGFRIDIETDSTIRADLTRNQEQMTQFLAGTGQFVQGMVQAAQFMPPLIPTMVEVYTAFARNFSLGKQAEDALDRLAPMVQQMTQQMQQQQQEDPEAEARKEEREMERERHGHEMQREQIKTQGEAQKLAAQQQDREHKLMVEAQRAQMMPQSMNGVN